MANMFLLLSLALVSSIFATAHVQSQQQHRHLRALKSTPLVANATKVGALPVSLAKMAEDCKCVFDGACTCEMELKFMNCIRDACQSGKCACQGIHFLDACKAMDATCPDGGLQCSEDKASCLNGAAVARPQAASIKSTGATAPEIVDAVPEVSPTTESKSGWIWTRGMKVEPPQPTLSQKLWGTLVYILLAVLFAFLYYKFYILSVKESFGERHAGTWFAFKQLTEVKHDEFKTHLCEWYHTPKLCVLSCCCPCLVWAHTADKAQVYKALSYWRAFALFFALMLFSDWTYGWGCILIAILGTVFRQALRKQYKIVSTPKTIAKDFLIWCCCSPCAIVQEHAEEHYQATHAFKH